MPAKPGYPKPNGSGRTKGTPNKKSWDARAVCDALEFEPIREVVSRYQDCRVYDADGKIYPSAGAYLEHYREWMAETLAQYERDLAKDPKAKPPRIPKPFYKPMVPDPSRDSMLREVLKYIYPQLKSIELDGQKMGDLKITVNYEKVPEERPSIEATAERVE